MNTHAELIPIYQAFWENITTQSQEMSFLLSQVFNAWENGHTFAYLDAESLKIAHNAPPEIIGTNQDSTPLLLIGHRLFLNKVRTMERICANRIQKLYHHQTAFRLPENDYFNEDATEQKQATQMALQQGFTLITGGPGTGKTYTVSRILALLCKNNETTLPHIALTAPTGKAAANLQDSLRKNLPFRLPENIAHHLQQLEGKTLHRLLGITPPLMRPQYHRNQPLPYDVIIVDEASMIDLSLMTQLLQATRDDACLILLGDENQLPAVGTGAILSAVAKQEKLTARLTKSRRFQAASAIGHLAKAIIEDDENQAWDCFHQYDTLRANEHQDFYHEWYQTQQSYWQAVDSGSLKDVFEHFYDGMVLCALRYDVERFNRQYLSLLREKREIAHEWFAGRAVMMTQNQPSMELSNGDIGIILPNREGRLMAYFKSGTQAIDIARLTAYEDAFAMTVHKSQGSEYRQIRLIAPQSPQHELFDRALLYTAITRVKESEDASLLFQFYGSEESFKNAIHHLSNKRTGIEDFLKEI
ncbi:MAG: exodeoxyribonuclease V subunit alpha [Neisseriaceae bacterium]|nr:exodeoxyribonuclease V subunit alpha [Neisseriaceae bacterium]